MDARTYLSNAGLTLDPGAVLEAQRVLWNVLDEAKHSSMPATPSALSALYQFRVPKQSTDGSCSLHDELDPMPYDLSEVLGGRSVQISFALITIDALVDSVHQTTKAGWVGVYQARTVRGGRALVKLAYRGAESRAEYPLTEDFARQSNNSTVGLSGKALIIDDLTAHRERGGPYYECDPKVQSEACLPVFGPSGAVIGIVDAEANEPRFFTPERLASIAALALEAGAHLPR